MFLTGYTVAMVIIYVMPTMTDQYLLTNDWAYICRNIEAQKLGDSNVIKWINLNHSLGLRLYPMRAKSLAMK